MNPANVSRSLAVAGETLQNVALTGSIIPVEFQSGDVAKLLDQQAGIDYLVHGSSGVVGVALRSQFIKVGNNPFNTFSVRYRLKNQHETEFEKRHRAIKQGNMFPTWTIQSYFDTSGMFLSAARILTQDLYQYIDEVGNYAADSYVNPQDGNQFLACRWSHIKRLGYQIYITGSL